MATTFAMANAPTDLAGYRIAATFALWERSGGLRVFLNPSPLFLFTQGLRSASGQRP